jgi:hypothetical protein
VKFTLEAPLPPSLWPKPAKKEAWQGPAGELVQALEAQTEADPHAVLSILLTGFGNLIGRGPHAMVGRTRHALNLFTMNVGTTATSRKGTARSEADHALKEIDPTWPRPANGLSSGEGLIEAVRDPVKGVTLQSKKAFHKPKLKVVDPGVTDKRLLVFESEFSSVLHRMRRDGNSLSSVVQQVAEAHAWLRSVEEQLPTAPVTGTTVCSNAADAAGNAGASARTAGGAASASTTGASAST